MARGEAMVVGVQKSSDVKPQSMLEIHVSQGELKQDSFEQAPTSRNVGARDRVCMEYQATGSILAGTELIDRTLK